MRAKIVEWDRRVVWRVYRIQNAYITRFLKIVSHVGSTPFWILVGLGCYIPGLILWFGFPIYRDLASTLLNFCSQLFTAFFISGCVLIPIKYSVYRQRPYQKYGDILSRDYYVTDPSFPSGHCAQWILYGWVAAVYLVGDWYIYLVVATLPLIMLSRIHLGCHFPSDTLVGAVLGALIIGLVDLLTPMFNAWFSWASAGVRFWFHQLFGV